MSILTTKSATRLVHPVFAGLSERGLNAVHSAGTSFGCAPGEDPLAGRDPAAYHLVLDGRCRLASPEGNEGMHLGGGDLLDPALASGAWQARATTAMQLFTLTGADLDAMESEVRLQLQDNLLRLRANALARWSENWRRQTSQRERHFQGLADALAARRAQYAGSAAIKSLLRKVPRLPPYANKLTSMLVNNNISARDVAEVARLDPSLTASVLKTVNSSSFGLTHKVTDIQHAFVLLGFNQLYQVVVQKGVQSTMPRTPEFQELQMHSVLISVLGSEISLTLKQGNAALLGTTGLLHDIGKSVILLLRRQQPALAFLVNLLDPDLIGAMLLREWKIPPQVCDCLDYLTLSQLAPPDSLPAEHRVNLAVLALAHGCADFLLHGSDDGGPWFDAHCAVLGCDATSPGSFVRDQLAPAIKARGNRLPRLVKGLLERRLGSAPE